MDRFLVIRFGSIGNTLVCIPAVRAVKKKFPASFIAIVVSPGIDDLISDIPWIDERIVYDMHGVHKSLSAYLRFIRGLRKRHFDTAILFKRFLRSELIGLLSGARRRIGFATNGKAVFLTDRVAYTEDENIVRLNMELVRPLGIVDNDLSLELGIRDCSGLKSASLLRVLRPSGGGRYAAVHPGGKTVKSKGLGIDGYAACVTRLYETHRIPSVVIGDAEESGTVDRIVALAKPGSAVAATGLTLKDISCLIRDAALFIGNDSGPCHIADAVGTPGIIIYPPMKGLREHLRKWKPSGDNYLAVTPEKSCDSCTEYPCDDAGTEACMGTVDLDLILKYTGHILRG